MAVFDRKSRYVKPALEPYKAVDVRGREVNALPPAEPPLEVAVGRHVTHEGQTLDQLASSYLADPHAYWRIAELNDAILPDGLVERAELDIPDPTRR
jgi:hypothetical protein